MPGTADSLVLQLSSGFGQALEPQAKDGSVEVQLAPRQVSQFMRFAKEQLGFDMLTSITAVDNVETFELLYHFTSVRPVSPTMINPAYPSYLVARVRVEKEEPAAEFEPEVASIVAVYPGANQQEREIWDLMGIRFKGHPKLERILLWEGFPGHPLRKDWRPLNAEIPWHLAGLKGFGWRGHGRRPGRGPDRGRRQRDGGGDPGGDHAAVLRPPRHPPAPAGEKLHLHIGQGGITDEEGPEGPRG